MKIGQLKGAIVKHLLMNNYRPYARLLKEFSRRGDIWLVSQGEFMRWWLERERAGLKITIANGTARIQTSLENGVIEKFPGEFLDSPTLACEGTQFSGPLRITIDRALKNKELLLEILQREGILNVRIAAEGQVMLSEAHLGPLLALIETKLRERGRLFEADVRAVRQIVIDQLAAHNLPLLRLWYYPRLNGVIQRAVFSPRYDVDRAITNLGRIRKLEKKYGVSSTLYLRAFCPFYSDEQIKKLASQAWCSEIALHGEFSSNAGRYGSELEAAQAEKGYLERLIGRPVLGVCMHGGELSSNTNSQTSDVVQKVALLYDTTQRMKYYFPFRKMINGRLSKSYSLMHPLGDIIIPANRAYGRQFYEQTIAKMDEIYGQNGVFVFMLHPVYFGFFRYLAQPQNWGRFVSFCWRLLTGSQHIVQEQVYHG